MSRDSDYEDEELERQREAISKKIRTMSDEGPQASSQRSSRSGRSSSRSSDAYRDEARASRVTQFSDEEVEYRPKRKSSNKSRKKRRKRKIRRTVTAIIIVLVVIIAVIFGAVYYMLNGLTRTDLEGDLADSGGVSYIKNVALFGVDSRDADSNEGLSDAILIASVNKRTGEINLISILRDSYVSIEGYGDTKINAAYSYGGASLAVKTLNQTFDLDITDYITVNFAELAQIIDAAGGVTIEITAEEAEQINKNLDDAAEEDMTVQDVTYVEVKDGTVTLNGDQAVAYSRIRKIDSDNVRASRQQTVLSALLNNIKEMPVLQYPSFIKEFMSASESSLSTAEIMSFAPLIFKDFTINTYTVPDIEYETDLTSGYNSSGQWCYFYDTDAAAQRIHSIIYGDE